MPSTEFQHTEHMQHKLGISKAPIMAQHTSGDANTDAIRQHARDTPSFALLAPAQQHTAAHNEDDSTNE